MAARSIGFLLCAGVAWTAVGYKVAALRRAPRNLALWVLTVSIALPATGFTLATPVVYTAVGDLVGVPNLASLLVYGCIVGYSVSALIMLLLWHLPPVEALPRAGLLLVCYAAVLVAMVVLFVHSGATTDHPIDFDVVYGPTPAGGSFLLLYVTAFAAGLGAGAWRGAQFAARVARSGGRPWLRRGLRLVAAGSTIALGYCVGKGGFVIAAWLGADLTPLSDLGTLCACLGALVITVGFTIPSWGPRLSAATDRLRRARTYLRLYPLWQTMYRAVPDIALDPPRSRWADLLRLRDLDFALYRRLIEIRDGRLALAPYLPSVDGPVPAPREAARIRAAAARLLNHGPARPADAPAGLPTGYGDLAGDLEFVVQVSMALRSLPAGPIRPTPPEAVPS